MIENAFSQALGCLSASNACLVTDQGSLTVGELLNRAQPLREWINGKQGLRIALSGLAPATFLDAILAFDGWAEAMLLLPASLTVEQRETLIATAACTHVLTDDRRLDTRRCDQPPMHCPAPTRWLLATSGTTGTPKLIEHTLASLSRTIVRNPERACEFQWGLLYDPSRFAGLQVVLQALLSGSVLVLPRSSGIDDQTQALLRHPVNALSGTPSLWRKFLMDGRLDNLMLRQVTLGGEIADQTILESLQLRYPQARVTHIYASTEAGTGFAVKDGRAGFPAAWLDSPTGPVRMKVSSDGHLWIRPPILPAGDEVSRRLDHDGYLDTEDLVRIVADRVLFLGRASGTINVGGNKINPEAIENIVREVEGVLDVRIYAKRSSMMGQLVAAEVIATTGADTKTLRRRIQQHCQSCLETWQMPALIGFVSELSVTAAGKIARPPV